MIMMMMALILHEKHSEEAEHYHNNTFNVSSLSKYSLLSLDIVPRIFLTWKFFKGWILFCKIVRIIGKTNLPIMLENSEGIRRLSTVDGP
jgi:hypothetical protein